MAKKEISDKPSKAKKPATKRVSAPAAASKEAKDTAAVDVAPKQSTKKAEPQPRRPLLGKTPLPAQGSLIGWRLVDANGMTLGRLSSCIAHMLMGKDKPGFIRFADTGDHVIVINADKIVLTGNKRSAKTYYHHTNYPGGIKQQTANEVLEGRFPERIVQWAVYGMLPKGHLGRRWYKKLHVYAGANHPHTAQKPVVWDPAGLRQH